MLHLEKRSLMLDQQNYHTKKGQIYYLLKFKNHFQPGQAQSITYILNSNPNDFKILHDHI